MRYKTNKIYIPDIGTIPSFIVKDTPMETKEEEVLWHINKMREHDHLIPLTKNSAWLDKIKYVPIEEE